MSRASSAWLGSSVAWGDDREKGTVESYKHLPQREGSRSSHSHGGCPGLLQEHSSAPTCRNRLSGTLCLLEHPLCEGDFGTQSPVFGRNHKLKELCSLETENLVS